MTIFSENNPFILSGYESADYFCDRKEETKNLIREITSGNNVTLISTRRMGKTGLIQHFFAQKEIQKTYNTFFIDIYATKSLRDFTFLLGKIIFEQLKPIGKKALEEFLKIVKSLQSGVSFDITGNPSLYLNLGDIKSPQTTLDEIFFYIKNSSKPSILAIDEFQQIASYPEKNIEALLRTYVQQNNNSKFIFAGSQYHVMGNIFLSPSRPFYQSVSMINLKGIDIEKYTKFALYHFKKNEKTIEAKAVKQIYEMFDGITWYVQVLVAATRKREETATKNLSNSLTIRINL